MNSFVYDSERGVFPLEAVYQAIHEDPYWETLRVNGIRLVPGYGQPDPKRCKVMIVGEAPGATENAKGRPFCGPSGRVLNMLMAAAGLRLDDEQPRRDEEGYIAEYGEPANAFVTNVVKYRPPGNRTPTLYDIMHSKGDPQFLGYGRGPAKPVEGGKQEALRLQAAGSLRAEWRALGGPKVIVCVGGVAHSAMSPVGSELGVTAAAGNAFPARSPDAVVHTGYWVFSQLHPAYGLRKGEAVQKMMSRHWADMGEFLQEEGIL